MSMMNDDVPSPNAFVSGNACGSTDNDNVISSTFIHADIVADMLLELREKFNVPQTAVSFISDKISNLLEMNINSLNKISQSLYRKTSKV